MNPRRMTAGGLVAVVTALAAACGGPDPVSVRPPFPPFFPDGTVPVDAFASYAETVDERWERDAEELVLAFLEPWLRGREHTAASVDGPEGKIVTVTVEGLEDDSIRDERMEVATLERGDLFALDSARWSQRCWPNRGHQDFSIKPCV